MRNIRLTLEFDGAGFHGWQYQPDRRTVQGELQAAICRLTGEQNVACGCSRTDAGVSAWNYVANFHTRSTLALERLRCGLNHHLPREIHVKSVEDVSPDFNARFSARAKTYRYRLVTGRSPLRRARAWELKRPVCVRPRTGRPVDAGRMKRALKLFQGKKDLRAFCQTKDRSGVCTVSRLRLEEHGDEILIRVSGDRFLYKMVRRIVGAAVAYGAGNIGLADIKAALAGRKHRPFQTAPAKGLVLDKVEY